MKKLMLTMMIIAAMILPSMSYGNDFPDKYYGEAIPAGTYEVEAWVIDWHDMNPWGMPNPSGTYFMFGELSVWDGWAYLRFTQMGTRVCKTTPWGSYDGQDICVTRIVIEDQVDGIWSLLLSEEPRSDGTMFYLSEEDLGDGLTKYFSITYDPESETATYVDGTWIAETDPIFQHLRYESDDHTRLIWTMQERRVYP